MLVVFVVDVHIPGSRRDPGHAFCVATRGAARGARHRTRPRRARYRSRPADMLLKNVAVAAAKVRAAAMSKYPTP